MIPRTWAVTVRQMQLSSTVSRAQPERTVASFVSLRRLHSSLWNSTIHTVIRSHIAPGTTSHKFRSSPNQRNTLLHLCRLLRRTQLEAEA